MLMKRIIGNWKMHKTVEETAVFMQHVLKALSPEEVYLAVPFTAIKEASGFGIHVGAQNVSHEPEGPFTGEISARMIKDVGASFVLIGHSERRHIYGESDDMVHRKILRSHASGLKPVLCVGEREGEDREAVLHRQIERALKGLEPTLLADLTIAYEPVWAIGTGKSASPEEAASAHAFCRDILAGLFSKEIAALIPLLYGGSVKADNILALLEHPEIQGALVGGASLDPAVFVKLVELSKSVVS